MLEKIEGAYTNTSGVAFVQVLVRVNIGVVGGEGGEGRRGRRSGAAEEKGEECKEEHRASLSD